MDFKCISCQKTISEIYPTGTSKPETSSFNDGVVGRIAAGYGSRFDGTDFWIAVCDDCMDAKLGDASIKQIPAGDKIFIYELSTLKDGGSVYIESSIGDFYIDNRVGSKTKSGLYNGIPGKNNSEMFDPDTAKELKWKLVRPLKEYSENRDAVNKELARKLIIDFIL